MKYDSSYYPNRCYHIELQWVICTGSAVQGMVSHLQRQARSCGITILQVPVFSDISEHPFRAPIRIPIPSHIDPHDLLSNFNFIYDPQSSASAQTSHRYQYMHISGVAFIRVEKSLLIWTYNYTPTLQPLMTKAFALLQDIQKVCSEL